MGGLQQELIYSVYFLLPLPFSQHEQSFHLESTAENMAALFLEELAPEKKNNRLVLELQQIKAKDANFL